MIVLSESRGINKEPMGLWLRAETRHWKVCLFTEAASRSWRTVCGREGGSPWFEFWLSFPVGDWDSIYPYSWAVPAPFLLMM